MYDNFLTSPRSYTTDMHIVYTITSHYHTIDMLSYIDWFGLYMYIIRTSTTYIRIIYTNREVVIILTYALFRPVSAIFIALGFALTPTVAPFFPPSLIILRSS